MLLQSIAATNMYDVLECWVEQVDDCVVKGMGLSDVAHVCAMISDLLLRGRPILLQPSLTFSD